jgi:hypothetical protein
MRFIILRFFVLCNGNVAADVDHLHVKRIHLVSFFYIVNVGMVIKNLQICRG